MRSEFGQRLLDARKFAKLTQVQLADAVGMAQANLSELERSGQGSTYTPAIAVRCGVDVNWLAYGKGEMKPIVDAIQIAQHDALSLRRQHIIEDVAQSISRYTTPEDLRRLSAKMGALLDADWEALTYPKQTQEVDEVPTPAQRKIAPKLHTPSNR